MCPEVVEFACNIAAELKGEFVEHVSTGMDTYSIRQPLGVGSCPVKTALQSDLPHLHHGQGQATLFPLSGVQAPVTSPISVVKKEIIRALYKLELEIMLVQVCAGICPFNFPAMVPLWMWPLAVAAGNTFVLKPSEKDPGAAMMLSELAMEAGLPK